MKELLEGLRIFSKYDPDNKTEISFMGGAIYVFIDNVSERDETKLRNFGWLKTVYPLSYGEECWEWEPSE